MAEKPILFNTEMVKAILDGQKTQTRRVCKGQPQDGTISPEAIGYTAPYKPGDILWVRETWNGGRLFGQKGNGYAYAADYKGQSAFGWRPSIHMPKEAARLFLRVKDVRIERLQDITASAAYNEGTGKLFLEDIAYGDKNYGCDLDDEYGLAREQFAWLWNSTVKKADLPRYGWEANPWVWVIEFERCEIPEHWRN